MYAICEESAMILFLAPKERVRRLYDAPVSSEIELIDIASVAMML